eukprot:scpid53312/ scgid3552/ Synaptic vesicle 2-related protein
METAKLLATPPEGALSSTSQRSAKLPWPTSAPPLYSATDTNEIAMDEEIVGNVYPPTMALLGTEPAPGKDCFTIAEGLNALGIGPFHYRLVFIIGLISVATGLGSTGFSLFPPLARCHLHLDSLDEALLTSSGFAGAACGGMGIGYLATHFGRRTAIIMMILWISYFGFLSGITPGYRWLLGLRFVVGFGHGGAGQRVSILFENLPTRYRTLGAGVLTLFFNIGNFLEAVFIKVLIPTGRKVAWRYILFTDASLFAVCILFSCWITESPYFLLNIRGDRKKAYAVLKNISDLNHRPLPAGELVSEDEQRLGMIESQYVLYNAPAPDVLDKSARAAEVDSENAASPIEGLSSSNGSPKLSPSSPACSGSFMDFFRPRVMLKTTVLMSISWVSLSVAMVGATILTEEVLQERESTGGKCVGHFSVYHHHHQCDELSATQYTPVIVIFASEFPSLLITYYTANILGRRIALFLAFVFSGVFFALLLICPVSLGLTTFFLAGCRMMVTTAWSLMIVYTAEVYPTYIRGLAVGFSRTQYRIGSILVPFLSQVLLRKSVYASKSLHAGICIATGVMLLFLPIETKNRDLGEG